MTETGLLNCRELVELLTDYLEGALDGPAASRVAAHLTECEGCGAYLEQMTTILTSLRALRVEPVPEELQLKVAAAVRASAVTEAIADLRGPGGSLTPCEHVATERY